MTHFIAAPARVAEIVMNKDRQLPRIVMFGGRWYNCPAYSNCKGLEYLNHINEQARKHVVKLNKRLDHGNI